MPPLSGPSAWRERLAELGADAETDTAALRISRRLFLQLLGSSAALAGTACFDRTPRAVVPHVRDPEVALPGLPLSYATSMELAGYAVGLLVQSREGRPIKIEGNPDHPASLGAAGAYEQAALLDLYDPSRQQGVLRRGQPSSWRSLAAELGIAPGSPPAAPDGARRTRLLLEPTAGPLAQWLLDRIEERRPGARTHFHAPLESRSMAEATRAIFGAELEPLFDLDRAAVVLAVDADFTGSMPFSLRYARDLARRRGGSTESGQGRLYVAESAPTVTGHLADHRLLRPVSAHAALLGAVLREVATLAGAPGALVDALGPARVEETSQEWTRAVARDLLAHPGACAVLVGARQPPEAHAAGLALNLLLRNRGATLRLIPRALRDAATSERSLAALVEEMRAGEVETLVVLGGNPVYSAPRDLRFEEALAAVPRSVYLALHADETAQRSHWVVPQRHFLESWGDARAFDGTASLIQPLIRPLYEGASALDVLAALAGEHAPLESTLRERWTTRSDGASPAAWQTALERGVIEGTSAAAVETPPDWQAIARLVASVASPDPASGRRLELSFRPDARVYDGRFAHNVWLQELPDPITKLTWDNAAWIDPETARELGVQTGEWLRIRRSGRELTIPALVVAGCARGSVTLHLGYGRRAGVQLAQGVGFDAYALRTRDAAYFASDADVQSLAASGESRALHPLAFTQQSFDLHGRDASIVQLRSALDPPREPAPEAEAPSLYGMTYQAPEQWAMAIDLSTCNGCSACVVACQAENNVPIVGKDDVLRGREMHWLRIDRYLVGEAGGSLPEPVVQPMLCQHCEAAPCEYVCPVYATTHSADGLNQMVYNRCIGTRFCSNNCPYKVRRFNWFDYTAGLSETQKMGLNPEVTVRGRGVIEKCTFCVQRIRRAQIDARNVGRPLGDGEVQTACQQACPTRAIHFGSQTDAQSDVARTLAGPHVYAALEHLHTRPRVRYLAKLRNPNPALERARPQLRAEE